MTELKAETSHKQVIVLRRGDINMRMGKAAAQAAHASMATLTRGPGTVIREVDGKHELVVPLDEEAYAWLTGRFRKICVYVKSEAELLDVYQKALDAGLRVALIQDSGFTEFNGVPTYTAVAIGPHTNEKIDQITKKLPLL